MCYAGLKEDPILWPQYTEESHSFLICTNFVYAFCKDEVRLFCPCTHFCVEFFKATMASRAIK
jgi:hypothetical protein